MENKRKTLFICLLFINIFFWEKHCNDMLIFHIGTLFMLSKFLIESLIHKGGFVWFYE